MTELVLFHHVQGLTDGVRALADALSAGGRHTVHTPDLFGGELAGSIDDGFALVARIGDAEVDRRADAALDALPPDVVLVGVSFGVMAAQRLAQTRPGVRGALLYEACAPVTGPYAFGPWPAGLPVQVHGMDQDPVFALDGDLAAATELVQVAGPDAAELWTYPGDHHLFTDASLPSSDPAATALVVARSLVLLDRL